MANLSKALNRWKEVLLITLSIRIFLFVLAFVLSGKGLDSFFTIWVQWDGPHYLDIARNWYVTSGLEANWIVFYPLYPILIRLVSLATSDLVSSTILVSTVFSFTAAILLYELSRLDLSHSKALLAVWFLNIFPTSYFLQASYTESLFLTTSLATIYLFRKNKVFRSGLMGIFSTLGRVNGLLLLPLLLLETKNLKQLASIIIAPFGFVIYLVINYLTFRDPFYFEKPLFNYWHKKIDFPWHGLKIGWESFPNYAPDVQFAYKLEFITIAFILAVGIYSFFKIRRSYGVYTILNLLLFISTSFILSTPRYALALFPIYLTLAKMNRWLTYSMSLIFLLLLFYFTGQYTKGAWAF